MSQAVLKQIASGAMIASVVLLTATTAERAVQNLAAIAVMGGAMRSDSAALDRASLKVRRRHDRLGQVLLTRSLAVGGKSGEAIRLLKHSRDWPPRELDLRGLLGRSAARNCRTRDVMQLLTLPDGCFGDLPIRIAEELDRHCSNDGRTAYAAVHATCGATTLGLAALRLESDWYYRHGDVRNAILKIRELLAEEPDNGEAWAELARLLYDSGDYSGTVSVANHALSRPGRHSMGARGFRGAAYIELGRVQEAINDLNRSIAEELHPSPYTRLHLARAYRLVGNESAACEQLRNAFAIAPELAGRVSSPCQTTH